MTSRDHLSPAARFRDRLAAARRALLRRRRLLATLFTMAAVGAGVHALAPPPPRTVDVLVAARDLPAGAAVEADDLTTVALPPDVAPDHLVADPVGALLASPVRRGEPLTDARLVGPGLGAGTPGSAAVPIRLSDAEQAALLSTGDRIDLHATDPQQGTTTTVADDVVVLAVPDHPGATGDALTGRVVVLQVDSHLVPAVTGAAVTSMVTYAWSGG